MKYTAQEITELLASLPTYTNVVFHMQDGQQLDAIAQDIPSKKARRFTIGGADCFITSAKFARGEITSVSILPFDMSMAP